MRFISAILPFLSVCCLLPSAWGAGDMAPDLKSGAFWKLPQPDLFGKYFNGEPGGWVDKGKTQLRIAKPSIKIGDMSLGEMLVNWKDGAPQSMTVMMYNKGDNGAIGKDEFDKRLELIKESLTALTGIQPKEYRASRKEAVVKVNGWSWIWENGAITLEINTSREGREFEAEFIRMKAGPTEDSIARGDASSRARKADIKQHVRKEGKRVVMVQTVGMAVIAALIGAGGFGALVFQGLLSSAIDLVLLGVIPVIVLAVLTDALFDLLIALLKVKRND